MQQLCPNCKKPITEKLAGIWPFCSERCKMVDLGKWSMESYRIPGKEINPSANNEEDSEEE